MNAALEEQALGADRAGAELDGQGAEVRSVCLHREPLRSRPGVFENDA
jgi:hypothetical protein